jgi:hypothetical protein
MFERNKIFLESSAYSLRHIYKDIKECIAVLLKESGWYVSLFGCIAILIMVLTWHPATFFQGFLQLITAFFVVLLYMNIIEEMEGLA